MWIQFSPPSNKFMSNVYLHQSGIKIKENITYSACRLLTQTDYRVKMFADARYVHWNKLDTVFVLEVWKKKNVPVLLYMFRSWWVNLIKTFYWSLLIIQKNDWAVPLKKKKKNCAIFFYIRNYDFTHTYTKSPDTEISNI